MKKYAVKMKSTGVVLFGPVGEESLKDLKKFHSNLAEGMQKDCAIVEISDANSSVEQPISQVGARPEPVTAPIENKQPVHSKPVTSDSGSSGSVHSSFADLLDGNTSEYWKPREGRNLVRVLPKGGRHPKFPDMPYPFVMLGVHPNVGLSLRETVCCSRLTFNEACPICNFVSGLYRTNSDDDRELAKSVRAYKQVLANIIDLNDVKAGVQVWSFGVTLGKMLVSYLESPDTKDVLDATSGSNFILVKDIVDGYPKYSNSRFERTVTPLSQIYSAWESDCKDLTSFIKRKSYEELTAVVKETREALLNAPLSSSGNKGNLTPRPGAGDNVTEVELSDLEAKLNNL